VIRRGARATRILLILGVVMIGVTTVDAETWEWPSDELSSLRTEGGTVTPWFVLEGARDRDGEDVFRPVAPGEVIYSDALAPDYGRALVVPRPDDRLVVRHDGGMWSVYRGGNMRVPAGARSPEARVTSASPVRTDGPVIFSMLDASEMRMVSPRALLPESDGLPVDEMPVLGFRQNGEPVRARNLVAGAAELVVPGEWLQPVTLPRRMYVLVDGLLAADISFLVPGDVSARVTADGDLFILERELDPGLTQFEIEVERYDGTTESRTIRVRVPEPLPLDTP